MNYQIKLTRSATKDLQGIYDYYLVQQDERLAAQILVEIRQAILSLNAFPERGAVPREMQETGNRRYRQLHQVPFRIIYRFAEQTVFVVMIVDERRDLRSALLRRQLI